MRKILFIILFPFLLPSIISYLLMNKDDKSRLKKDITRFWARRKNRLPSSLFASFYLLMAKEKSFRGIFYMRAGRISNLFSWILTPPPAFDIPMASANVGGGIFVEHGYAMTIDAANIGENLWINQNVTIGWGRNGHPSIGDNVRIGTGAVVLGGIKIGNNVNIGANAIVVGDVPDNCTVCSPKAKIIKYHDGPTMNAQLTSMDGGGVIPCTTSH